MRTHRLIAATAAGAVCLASSAASGRFLQVDPVGYKDQINLYAYVNDDPINASDPTGTTCTSSQQNERTVYSCRIDKVAIVNREGGVTGTRAPTAAENRRFATFNARYTAAVNKLMRNPDRAVTVAPIRGREGSFQTTAGKAAAALISREFQYATRDGGNQALATSGGPGLGLEPTTYVRPIGLREGGAGIVHDGGLHGTPEEATGGLQRPGYPLNRLDHQEQYNEAACRLLESEC